MSRKRVYSTSDLGRLYAVGVGPGDPDLMTLRARNVLSSVAAVFAPKSKREGESVALSVARGAIREGTEISELHFPMSDDEKILRPFWDKAAESVLAHLRRGRDAAFVTLGDPCIYSTVGYLAQAVLAKEADVQVAYVPGVTSFSAAAARVGKALVEGDKPLAVIPTVSGWNALPDALKDGFSLVLMKAGRRLPELVESLKREGRLAGTVLASRLGLEGEQVIGDIAADGLPVDGHAGKDGSMDYLTLLLVPAREARDHSEEGDV